MLGKSKQCPASPPRRNEWGTFGSVVTSDVFEKSIYISPVQILGFIHEVWGAIHQDWDRQFINHMGHRYREPCNGNCASITWAYCLLTRMRRRAKGRELSTDATTRARLPPERLQRQCSGKLVGCELFPNPLPGTGAVMLIMHRHQPVFVVLLLKGAVWHRPTTLGDWGDQHACGGQEAPKSSSVRAT